MDSCSKMSTIENNLVTCPRFYSLDNDSFLTPYILITCYCCFSLWRKCIIGLTRSWTRTYPWIVTNYNGFDYNQEHDGVWKWHKIQMILLFKTINNPDDIHHLYFPSIQSFIYVRIMPLVAIRPFNCCVLWWFTNVGF